MFSLVQMEGIFSCFLFFSISLGDDIKKRKMRWGKCMEGFIRINASRDEAEYRSSSFRRGVDIKLLSGRIFFFFFPHLRQLLIRQRWVPTGTFPRPVELDSHDNPCARGKKVIKKKKKSYLADTVYIQWNQLIDTFKLQDTEAPCSLRRKLCQL